MAAFYTIDTRPVARSSVKIVIPSRAWRSGSPMDLQEPLDAALEQAGLGEIVRGGAAPGAFFLEAEVDDVTAAVAVLRRVLLEHRVPRGTRIDTATKRELVHLEP